MPRAIYNGWRRDPNFRGEHKGLIYRAPVVNIERNPYWGRNEEAYGEDPFLTGRIGVAFVKGLQGDDPKYLKLVSTLKHYAVAKSLIAGCDFSDREFERYIPAAVRQGLLPEERLNDAVYRVMWNRFRLGEFDPPEMVPYSKISPDVICSPEHRALALKTAQKSTVLLANKDKFLPLAKGRLRKIAGIGPHADQFTRGGAGVKLDVDAVGAYIQFESYDNVVNLGSKSFERAGRAQLRFTAVGKNPRSSSYTGHFDAITLARHHRTGRRRL